MLVGDELVVLDVVAEGDASAHEEPDLERGVKLVPDAVAQHFTLELREATEDVHHHAAGCVGRVELLGDGDESDVVGLKEVVQFGEVGERAGEPVDLVDDDQIDLAGLDVRNQLVQGGAVDVAAGESSVAVFLRELPAVGLLALDVRERGVALGVQRVVLLFESLLGRLAHIHGATLDFDLLHFWNISMSPRGAESIP